MRVFLCLKLVQNSLSKFLLYITFFTRNFFYELYELFWSFFASNYGDFCHYYIILAGFLYLVRRIFLQIILFTQGFFSFWAFGSATPICHATTCAASTDLNCKLWCLRTTPKPAHNAHHHLQSVRIRRTCPFSY